MGFMFGPSSNNLLEPYGTRALDLQLRDLSRNPYGSLFMGGQQILAKQLSSTSWIVRGDRNVDSSQELLQQAEWGGGIVSFMEALVRDFCTYNIGAFIEIVGHGDSDKPIVGKPLGIKLFDPLRCYLTGDPEHPVLYENWWMEVATSINGIRRDSKQQAFHKMHHSRVHRIVDMLNSDEGLIGMGESAMFRYVGHHYRQILMGRYSIEKLSDQPPAGFLVMGNVKAESIDESTRTYEAQRAAEGQTVWRNVQRLESVDPSQKIDVNFVSFSGLPDGFDYGRYMEIDRNIVALSLGIDPQDIWPLSGGLSGTAGQSKVLSEKSRGRSLGLLYEQFETFVNTKVLPPSAEFEFKPEDTNNDSMRADRAQKWMDVALGVNADSGGAQIPILTPQQQIQLLANTVPEIRDVVTDDNDEIILPSNDILDAAQTDRTVPEPPKPDVVADSSGTSGTEAAAVLEGAKSKAYSDTRNAFITDIRDLMKGALNRDITRTRFGIVMRGILTRQGRRAYIDGLADGGVKVDALEADDKKRFNAWMIDQSSFVTEIGRAIYRDDSTFNPDSKATIWANKSLNQVYQSGLLAADMNAMYKWIIGSTEEHCKTCLKANGQVHRLKAWERTGIMPQANKLECGGYHCKCTLKRVTGKAVGRLNRVPRMDKMKNTYSEKPKRKYKPNLFRILLREAEQSNLIQWLLGYEYE